MLSNLLNFLDEAKTKFEAIRITKDILIKNGFVEVKEADSYKGYNKFFIIRNNSSIIAISKPNKIDDLSINIISTHTDSPSFKINENSNIEVCGINELQTEAYGGAIYSTWFDRPLSIGGRVFIKDENRISQRLIAFNKNICTIPNLCIHFSRDINKGHEYTLDEMKPILGYNNIYDALDNEFNIKRDDILSFELELYNNEHPTYVGLNNEFYMASRIDNLASHYVALNAFLKSNDDTFKVFSSFDNEEVGSSSMQGAGSLFLRDTLKRIFIENGYSEIDLNKSLSNSILISADNAHALNPNYMDKYNSLNAVYLNKGFVIKESPNLKYTTDGFSKALIVDLCKKNNIKYQQFRNKPGTPGGSTLGNILQKSLSIHMVDIGLPQYAMHSSYETAGSYDILDYYNIMKEFYNINLKIDNENIIY